MKIDGEMSATTRTECESLGLILSVRGNGTNESMSFSPRRDQSATSFELGTVFVTSTLPSSWVIVAMMLPKISLIVEPTPEDSERRRDATMMILPSACKREVTLVEYSCVRSQ